MKLQKQRTNKLFFNKWPFKISCFLLGANRVKYAKPWRVRLWILEDRELYDSPIGWNSKYRPKIDKFELHKFTNAVEPFLERDDIQIRTEGGHFNLFCKDIQVKEEIISATYPWITGIYGPETLEELEFLLEGNYKIVCTKLPYEKFKYKVVLKDYIENTSVKQQLLNYLDNLGEDKVRCSPSTKEWLNGFSVYKQDPFFYITEEKSLTFIRLLTNDIKKVYEYVERDNINTSL